MLMVNGDPEDPGPENPWPEDPEGENPSDLIFEATTKFPRRKANDQW